MKSDVFRKLLFILMMFTWSLVILQSLALAQMTYPTKPVAIWVGFSALIQTSAIKEAA